jgi:hypothetical protein
MLSVNNNPFTTDKKIPITIEHVNDIIFFVCLITSQFFCAQILPAEPVNVPVPVSKNKNHVERVK